MRGTYLIHRGGGAGGWRQGERAKKAPCKPFGAIAGVFLFHDEVGFDGAHPEKWDCALPGQAPARLLVF